MDDITLHKFKTHLAHLKSLDLSDPHHIRNVMWFYEEAMPKLLNEVDRLQREVERIHIRNEFSDHIR